jgi:potassium-transporting ATPase KdpC subunit
MRLALRPALALLVALTLVTGVLYPLVVTGLGALLFPRQARGSLIVEGGVVRGSALIGQAFDQPQDFWGRPSATSRVPYDAALSSGSNLGPSNPALRTGVADRIAALRAADPAAPATVPVDLVTASGSGLDPHISPEAAEYQVARVARARGLAPASVRALVARFTETPQFGVLGEPRVNVLRLNLALDAIHATSPGDPRTR